MLICLGYVLWCLIVLTARILVKLCFLMTHYSKRDLMASLFSQAKRNVYLQSEVLSEYFNRKSMNLGLITGYEDVAEYIS